MPWWRRALLVLVDDLTTDPLWWARSDSAAVMTLDRAGCAALRLLPEGPARARASRTWRALVHRGHAVECPVCGNTFRHFAHRWNAGNVVCWSCGSHERHRTLWLMLVRQRPELLAEATTLLHFAPEPGLERHLRSRTGLRYVTCDLQPDGVDRCLDITAIDLPDASVDAIICSHVLEHVLDDVKAMQELRRILAPGGWCIVMVPVARHFAATDEDASVTDPAERRRRFWQEDHVRLYGLDIADRLRAAKFTVDVIRPTEALSPDEINRFRLRQGEDIFLCR